MCTCTYTVHMSVYSIISVHEGVYKVNKCTYILPGCALLDVACMHCAGNCTFNLISIDE